MRSDKRKRFGKILLCIIISFVIDFLYLYAEFYYFIYGSCTDTFFGLFKISNSFVEEALYVVIALIAGVMVAIAGKLLKLTGKGKKLFIIVHSIVIVGYLLFWYML